MVTTLKLDPILTDNELDKLKGTFIDNSFIKHTIDYDCDIFDNNDKLIVSFRKNKLLLSELALQHYKHFAKASRGRGASAGPIDPNSNYWKKRELINTSKYSTGYLVNGKPSKMKVNNQVFSNPIGYFDATRGLNGDLPCRLTHYTKTNLEDYNAGLPYIQEIGEWYRRLNPICYKKQLDRSNLKTNFKIPDTPFSTFTCNRNFRTALHKDKGDFGGVACLSVIEEGQYSGGEFVIPKFGIGINIREGDILVADVHQYHGNTVLYTTEDQDIFNLSNGKTIKENVKVGTAGINYNFTRISFVCYLREKIIKCE